MEVIKANQNLERLELEGNELGPKTASKLGELLNINYSIRVIDLEGNNLTNGEKAYVKEEHDSHRDNSGIKNLCEALKDNTTLLSLNMSNCNLDD